MRQLEGNRGSVCCSGMARLRVVVVLDVVTDRVVRFSPGLEGTAMHEFLLQRGEEALGNRVVVAVSSGRHTAFDVVALQQSTIGSAGVLAAAVGVMHQPRSWSAPRQSAL